MERHLAAYGSHCTQLSLYRRSYGLRPTASIRMSLYCHFAGAFTARALQLGPANHLAGAFLTARIACKSESGSESVSKGERGRLGDFTTSRLLCC